MILAGRHDNLICAARPRHKSFAKPPHLAAALPFLVPGVLP